MTNYRISSRFVSLAALSLALAGCGGGNDMPGNPAPTPSPSPTGSPTPPPTGSPTPTPTGSPTPTPTDSPSPTPTPTPTATAYGAVGLGVTGNATFESATSQSVSGGAAGSFGELEANPFANGTSIAWNAASETYTFTRDDGVSVSIDADDIIGINPSGGSIYRKEDGTKTHIISISGIGPVDGVKLTYHVISNWQVIDTAASNITNQAQVWGLKTETMPATGTASYDVDGGINATAFDGSQGWNLRRNSTGSFDVDFASGDIATVLNLVGDVGSGSVTKDFGTFNGTGAITSGAEFAGDFGPDSAFYGAFFGPAANEIGYSLFISTDDVDITGTVSGFKGP